MSLAQKPGLKFAEVEFFGEPWNKVVASRFSKCHAKFLGKNMPGEGEQAWHTLQSADGDVTMAMMRTMNSFRDVMSPTSTQTLFRTSTRSGSVLNIFVPTTTQSQDMTSVTNAVHRATRNR